MLPPPHCCTLHFVIFCKMRIFCFLFYFCHSYVVCCCLSAVLRSGYYVFSLCLTSLDTTSFRYVLYLSLLYYLLFFNSVLDMSSTACSLPFLFCSKRDKRRSGLRTWSGERDLRYLGYGFRRYHRTTRRMRSTHASF